MHTLMSYEEALATTQALFEKVGLDQSTFNEKSVKTFHDLVMEVRRGEIILSDIGIPGMLKRTAWNSRLIIRTSNEYLVEIYRIYPGRTEPVIKKTFFINALLDTPNWALSETALKTEDPLEVILRGIFEEMGIILSPKENLKCLNPGEAWIDTHASSVYYGIITENHTTWFEWRMKERHGPDSIIRRDDHVELHLEWNSYNLPLIGNY